MPKITVYVARKECGCIVAAIADDTMYMTDPDEQEKKRRGISDVLRLFYRLGYEIDRVMADDVPMQWFSECPHEARQKRFDEVTITNMQTGERTTLP